MCVDNLCDLAGFEKDAAAAGIINSKLAIQLPQTFFLKQNQLFAFLMCSDFIIKYSLTFHVYLFKYKSKISRDSSLHFNKF